MEKAENDAERWASVRDAVVAGDFESAAKLIMQTRLLPGLRLQLQRTFPRLPVEYVNDAVAEAVGETFVRLEGGKPVDPSKVGGYIFNTAKNIATETSAGLKRRHLYFDAETTPYDPELAATHGLGEVTDNPGNRLAALQFVAALIDLLPSSDNPKAVLKVRFAAAIEGDWLTDGEVAEILGREKTSISSWWRRGLADLRLHCQKHGITREGLEALADEFDEMESEVPDVEEDDFEHEEDEDDD